MERIMIVVNSRFLTQKITGVQRYAIEVSRQLKRLRPDIKFVSPENIIHTDIAVELEVETVGRMTGHLWEQINLPRYLAKNYKKRPLLLCLANSAPLFYKYKVVAIHDVAFLANPRWFSKRFYYLYRFLIPRVARKAQKVITVSEFSKNEIAEKAKVDRNRIDIVPNAASSKFHKADKIHLENRYGKYILAVSSLAPSKNIERIIKSYQKLRSDNIKLIITGAGGRNYPDYRLNELINGDPSVILAGHLEDAELIGLYRNALLFVYPSLYEGFGLPPLEAMACGCPAVVSKTASLPEVCGDAAFYVDPYDTDDIARGMEALINDKALRQRLIQKGKEQARRYDWGLSARKMLDILDNIECGADI